MDLHLFVKSVLGIVFFHHLPQVIQKARQEQCVENIMGDHGKSSSKGTSLPRVFVKNMSCFVLLTRSWTRQDRNASF